MNSNINALGEEAKRAAEHKLVLCGGEMEITGVLEVLAFDDCCISLDTVCGALDIDGSGLSVKDLSHESRKISITGKVSGIWYTQKKQKGERRGIFSAQR